MFLLQIGVAKVRIFKVLDVSRELDLLIDEYEKLASDVSLLFVSM